MTLTEAETQTARRYGTHLVVLSAGALCSLLMAAGVLLWLRNGTAVFFETLSAGLAACF